MYDHLCALNNFEQSKLSFETHLVLQAKLVRLRSPACGSSSSCRPLFPSRSPSLDSSSILKLVTKHL